MTCLTHQIPGARIYSAPKVRNATAWGNAPGNLPPNPAALKARHEIVLAALQYLFRAFSALTTIPPFNLGRWPRLLHHAPLALIAQSSQSPRLAARATGCPACLFRSEYWQLRLLFASAPFLPSPAADALCLPLVLPRCEQSGHSAPGQLPVLC